MVQKSMSGLAAKIGKKWQAAHDSHKDDETEYSQFGELPAGIEGGIAQLVECKFDVFKSGDNAGEYYFLAAGVVVRPKEHSGERIEGLRTQIGPEPLCDTPNRTRAKLDDHLAWIYNELRKLGVDTASIDSIAELEGVCDTLKEEQPYFKFRTWKGKPQTEGPYAGQEPRVQHQWNGITDYEPDDDGGDIEDSTSPGDDNDNMPTKRPAAGKVSTGKKPQSTSTNGQGRPSVKPTASKPGKSPVKPGRKPEPEPDESDSNADGAEDEAMTDEEIIELAEQADADDEDAAVKMTDLALSNGITAKQIEKEYENWAAVAEAIISNRTEQSGDDEGEPEDTGTTTWSKGDVCKYKAKGLKKAVEMSIIAVDEAKEMATLKNLDNPKLIYKGVKWSDMLPTD
jgi:hypothetical protein